MLGVGDSLWMPPVLAKPGGFPPNIPAPGVDLDFMNSPASVLAALLTTTRASAGYADDQVGNWTSFSNNVPRITNKGLLVEEARTNSIRNNSMQGAVVGTPGTLPNNGWFVANGVGVTTNVIGIGTEAGIDYIDIQITGTTSNTIYRLAFDATGAIAASNGQTWSPAFFVKLVGGNFTNVSNIQSGFLTWNSVPVVLTAYGSNQALPTSAALGTQRYKDALTISDATVASVTPFIGFVVSNGAAINFTIRIGWPQLELGAFATSPIRTTSTAVARSQDVVTMTSPPAFGVAYTLFAKGTPYAPLVTAIPQNIVEASLDGGNRTGVWRNQSNGNCQGLVVFSSANQLNVSFGAWNPGVSAKTAVAAQSGDQAAVRDGGTVQTAAVSGVPVPTVVNIGTRQANGSPFDGYVERVALWPTTR